MLGRSDLARFGAISVASFCLQTLKNQGPETRELFVSYQGAVPWAVSQQVLGMFMTRFQIQGTGEALNLSIRFQFWKIRKVLPSS